MSVPVHHRIDPMVDFAFKRLFGTQENLNLLLHFLNAVLQPCPRLVDVSLENPFSEREFERDKLSVVDVRARDEAGNTYQIEVQLDAYAALPRRMLFTSSDLYQTQLQRGEDYDALRRVTAIWLCRGVVLREASAMHHRFHLHDAQHGVTLTEDLSIHVLELSKWRQPRGPLADEDRWALFFRQAQSWDSIPEELSTPELRQAMGTLKSIAEKEEDYHAYSRRRIFLWEQRQIQRELEEKKAALEALEAKAHELEAKAHELEAKTHELEAEAQRAEQEAQRAEQEAQRAEQEAQRAEQEAQRAEQEAQRAEQEAQRAEQETQRAEQEAQRLRALLLKAGLDPDAEP
ncbi:MAG: Rpn family recombination-promoting nuclease/putative transposase [Alphaproteobacteria bacterium]|nr:Rpn family recombination-promoting nuclease/putative transposase [Alphaproteobacteria bacterium]